MIASKCWNSVRLLVKIVVGLMEIIVGLVQISKVFPKRDDFFFGAELCGRANFWSKNCARMKVAWNAFQVVVIGRLHTTLFNSFSGYSKKMNKEVVSC